MLRKTILTSQFFLTIILSIGLLLRLLVWLNYSYWHDEALWILVTKNGLNGLWGYPALQLAKPPFFGLLVYFWAFLGNSELVLRLLPLLLGFLLIIMIYKAGCHFFDKDTGLIAALLVAISPFNIYYSQELSHYTLTALLALGSLYYMSYALTSEKISYWVRYVLFTLLTLYTIYTAGFLLIAMNLYFFTIYGFKSKKLLKWLISQGVVLCVYSILMLHMLPKQLAFFQDRPYAVDWISGNSLHHIIQFFRVLYLGYNAQMYVYILASIVLFPISLFGIICSFQKNKKDTMLFLFWIFVPLTCAILSHPIIPTFTYRNYIFVLPASYILLAFGIKKLTKYAWTCILMLVFLYTGSLYNYYANIYPLPEKFYREGVHPKKDNRSAIKFVRENFQDGDIIGHTCISTVFTFYFYFGHDASYGDTYFQLDSGDSILKYATNKKRLWIIWSDWEPQGPERISIICQDSINRFISENTIKKDSREFEGITVYLYEFKT